MLGKTHITLGMASALILTLPGSASAVVTAMAGGALGGWMPDLDARHRDKAADKVRVREPIFGKIVNVACIAAFLVLDLVLGKGMCRYVVDHWGIPPACALLALAILAYLGSQTEHRSFTHSFLGMALFCAAVWFFCRPAAIPFTIGYASHLTADFFNFRGLQLFFPLKRKYSLKKCPSNGRVNQILFWICLGLTVAAVTALLAIAAFAAG